MAQLGTVYLDVKFDASKAAADMKKAVTGAANESGAAMEKSFSERANRMGDQLTRAGRQISFGISAPLALFGKQAEEAFTGFESKMATIGALTNTSGAQVAQWTGQVKDLAGQFGVNAADVASGLYFIASAGQSGTQAIDTLTIATKASAIGMGDMQQVSSLLTSVMAAYGSQNINAAQTADILTGAVRNGKFKIDDLVGAMGPVLPIAGQLGVKFQDLAGAFAAMSLTGTTADQAATQLRQIMVTLEKPSASAAQALQSVGLNAATLQDDLQSKGLLSTLQELKGAFGDNDDAIAKVFGNVRALTGVYTLLNDKSGAVQTAMDGVANSAGNFDHALDTISQTSQFKLNQSMEQIHNSLIQVGSAVAPVVESFAKLGTVAVGALASLPEPAQAAAAGVGGLLVLAGPLTYSFGAFAKIAGGLGEGLSSLGARLGPALAQARVELTEITNGTESATAAMRSFGGIQVPAILPIATAAAGAIIIMKAYNDALNDAKLATDGLLKGLEKKNEVSGAGAFAGLQKQVDDANKLIAAAREDFNDAANNKNPLGTLLGGNLAQQNIALGNNDAAAASGTAAAKMVGQAQEIAKAYGVSTDQAASWVLEQKGLGKSFDTAADAEKAYGETTKRTTSTISQAVTTIGALVEQAKTISDPFFKAQTSARALADAEEKAAEGAENVQKAHNSLTDAQEKSTQATKNVTKAQDDEKKAALGVKDAIEAQSLAHKKLKDLLAGGVDAKGDALSLREAQLSVKEAQRAASGAKGTDPALDRERDAIALERAKLNLQKEQGAHALNLASAEKGVRDADQGVKDAQQKVIDASTATKTARNAERDAVIGVKDAQLKYNDAQRDAQRAYEDIAPVALAAAGAQSDMANALAASNNQGPAFLQLLDGLKTQYPDIKPIIDDVISKFKAAEPVDAPDGGSVPAGQVTGRAYGGSLAAGQLSQVNERKLPEFWEQDGRQYILPVSGGQVVPLDRAASASGGPGNVTNITGDMHVVAPNPAQSAYEIRRALRKKAFLGGGGRG